MQKHVNLVDLVKSFPTNIYLQNLASIQERTSPVKFAHLDEKSGKGSMSHLSTKVPTPDRVKRKGTYDCPLYKVRWAFVTLYLNKDPLTTDLKNLPLPQLMALSKTKWGRDYTKTYNHIAASNQRIF